MYIQTAIILLASFLNIGLGLFVVRNNRKNVVHQSFALFCTVVGFWLISAQLLKFYPSLLTGILTVSLGVSIGVTFFLFARVYPVSNKKPSLSFYAPFIITIIFLVFSGCSRLLLKDVIIKEDMSEPVFGLLYIPLMLYVTTLMIYSFYSLIKTYFSSQSMNRLKMIYLIIAITGFMGSVFISNGLLPSIGVYLLVDVGPPLSILWTFLIFIAISRHRLFGIKFVVGKFLYYLLTAAIPYAFFYFTFFIQTKIWGSIFTFEALVTGGVIAIFYIFVFKKVDEIIRKILEKLLIYSKYDPFETINKLLKVTSTELSMEKVVLNVLSLAKNVFNSEKIGLVLFDKDNRKILYKRLIGFDKKAHRNMRDLMEVVNFWDLQEQVGNKSEILVFEELVQAGGRSDEEEKRLVKIMNFMKEDQIAVLLPLNRKVQLNGLLLIGQKETEDAYTVQDIDLLESIVANASVAVGRALLYDQVERSADILQQKVDQATKQLRAKVVALEEARRRERDMVDILGHELRTPMSIIKSGFGFLQMIFNSKIRDKIDKETRSKVEKYNDRIFENIDREIQLINTLLSSTKIDTGKVELSRESVDIIDVVEDGIVGQKNDASKHALYLKFNKPPDWKKYPKVYADRARIQEVMDNILSNAVKYTEKGGVTVDIEHDEDFVTIHVIDTGIGIPKNELRNLGKKFYRVKQYTEGSKQRELKIVRAGGSGLGLYVTFGLVKAHGGKIWLESKLEKGTVFHFTVPIYKGQKQVKIHEVNDEKDVFKRIEINKS